jgi:bacteriocin leader peptide (microcyclamide/patellamide family)
MNNQNLMPNQAQPIDRITTGQLPSALAELSEEMLQGTDFGAEVAASGVCIPCVPSFDSEVTASICPCFMCSFDGDDAE